MTFAFHDRETLAPSLVRRILTKEVGLVEEEAMELRGHQPELILVAIFPEAAAEVG